MILALAAIYGTIAFSSNVLTTRFLADQWGRRKYVSLSSPSHPLFLSAFHPPSTPLSTHLTLLILEN